MAFTRFHDDPARIKKSLEETTFIGRYQLNTPGPGDINPFWEDPNIRLQQWGANLHSNTVELESDFRGLTRRLNRDLIIENDYLKNGVNAPIIQNYGISQPFVEESRSTHPAWMYRENVSERWEEPWINPQYGLEKPFQDNIQTRLLEKDNYIPVIPKYT
jgi:hypothetical protein